MCSPWALSIVLLPKILITSPSLSLSSQICGFYLLGEQKIGKCRKLQANDRELRGLNVLEKTAQYQSELQALIKGCGNFSIKPFEAIHAISAWKAQKDTAISYGLTNSKSVVSR